MVLGQKKYKMKTEEEWLKIYKECWNSFNRVGHNRVRLELGQFSNDLEDTWACIKIIGGDKETVRKILDIADKYNLRGDFKGNSEWKLWEEVVDKE
jgi:hypothetical protein